MTEVDLHLHTSFSDGRLTPTQIVNLCVERGLKVISVTDHDSTQGIPEALQAAKAFPQLTVIPGVELGADLWGAEIHLLGYFVNHEDRVFQRLLKQLREGRQERVGRMVEKLYELGVKISWEKVKELASGGAIGRPHIAQAMVEAGYVPYPKDAFDQYLGRDGPAYVARTKLTPIEAIGSLENNGALPVMAHPTYAVSGSDKDQVPALREILKELKESGLVGMEVYHGDYSSEQVDRLLALSEEMSLIPCGGSDYHASGNPAESEPGTAGPPINTVEALRVLRKRRTEPQN